MHPVVEFQLLKQVLQVLPDHPVAAVQVQVFPNGWATHVPWTHTTPFTVPPCVATHWAASEADTLNDKISGVDALNDVSASIVQYAMVEYDVKTKVFATFPEAKKHAVPVIGAVIAVRKPVRVTWAPEAVKHLLSVT